MAVADDLNEKLDELLENIRKYAPEGKRIPIALDEWATWTNGGPQPPARKGIPGNLKIPRDLGLYCAAETMRTALAEAGIMNLVQRRPGDFALGCKTLLYAYLSGEIGVRRDAVVASPCALMMGLYSTHDTCQALKTEVESATFRFKAIRPRPGSAAHRESHYLDTSARIHPDSKTVDVFVVNRNLKDNVPCRVEWIGGEVASDVEVLTLNSEDIYDWNTFDEPDTISIKAQQVPSQGDGLDCSFPAHSVTRLTFQVK